MKALRFLFLLSCLAVILGCEKEKPCENQECKDCLIAEAHIDYGNPTTDLFVVGRLPLKIKFIL